LLPEKLPPPPTTDAGIGIGIGTDDIDYGGNSGKDTACPERNGCEAIDQHGKIHFACAGRPTLVDCPPNSSGDSAVFECKETEGGVLEGHFNYSLCVSKWITDFESAINKVRNLQCGL
jgi:hypothetical protein